MADPTLQRPFPVVSHLVHKEGKTTGFREKKWYCILYDPWKIEIMPDIPGQCQLYRFITHEYLVPLDFPVSHRVVHNLARHDLGEYIWSLGDLIRSRCHLDNVFKPFPTLICHRADTSS